MLGLLPHAGPSVRHDDVCVLDGLVRVRHERELRSRLLRVFHRILDDGRIRAVVLRRRGDERHACLGRAIKVAVRHVVAVADIDHFEVAEVAALMLLDCQQIRQDLARMQQVCQRIDDRDARPFRKLLHAVMAERADHDAVEVARQHARRILDRLAAAELQIAVREEQRLPAELVHARFKRNTRARRGLLENHAERLALEDVVLHARLLHGLELLGEREDLVELVERQVVDG